MTDFNHLHPRNRKGEFRDVLGRLSKSDRLTNEVEVGITPYREGGVAKGADYYKTTRYKGFEKALPMMAVNRGLHFHSLDRVGGVWAGGHEPSAQVRVSGDRQKIINFMDAAGSRYNQDAVIAYTSRDGGPSNRYLSKAGAGVTNVQVAKAIEKVNNGKPEAEQIQGATVRGDGRLEVLDLEDNAFDTVSELENELGLTFEYDEGEGFLRFKHEDYPDAQGRTQIHEGRSSAEARGTRSEADERDGPTERGYDPDLYRRFGLQVPEAEMIEAFNPAELRDANGRWKVTADQLFELAKAKQEKANDSFRRYMHGESKTQSAAVRLQNEADDAKAELRFHPEFDSEKHDEYSY
jgi:hypothetical protein